MAALEAGLCCMERHEKRPEVPCEKQCASGTGPKVVLDKELSQGEKVATNARRKEVSKCFQRLGITGRQINEQKMSSHQAACENGRNPYPVYSAVEKSNVTKKRPNEPGTWFEFTPHRSGFPAYKTFVDTRLMGSEFTNGELKNEAPEKNLCYLQGLWGSALACKEEIWNTVIDFLRDVFTGSCCSDTAEQGAGLYSCPECSCRGCKGVGILLSDENLLKMKDPHKAQRLRHLAHVLKEIMERDLEEMSSETISEEVEYTLEVLQDTLNNTTGTCEMFKVIYHALACLANWEWGTTHNFLYNWKRSGGIPKDLTNQRYICLIDAGLEINSAYPLMLPPHRQVDLILSFDFSAGDPFMTLKQTAEYCRHNRIPFPKIHIEQGEEDNPSKSCYIFDGGESRTVPVVLHFPLFNRQNCQDDVQEWRERFTTFKLNYEESEVQDLLAVSKRNVELSKEKILEKLKQVYKE
ncbi:hypothetical protein FKM82_005208 [Ascaphus truei]